MTLLSSSSSSHLVGNRALRVRLRRRLRTAVVRGPLPSRHALSRLQSQLRAMEDSEVLDELDGLVGQIAEVREALHVDCDAAAAPVASLASGLLSRPSRSSSASSRRGLP